MMLDRRAFLILTAGAAAIPAMRDAGVLAQDATPAASPVADPRTMFGPVQGTSAYKQDTPFWQTMKEAVEPRAKED